MPEWFIISPVGISSGIKEGKKFVKLFMLIRIIGVAVTLYTADCCSLPDFKSCIDPVDDSIYPEFFVIGSSFVIGHRIAVEGGCQDLVFCGIW